MLSLIAGLPGAIAVLVCMRRGVEQAFLMVYLPTLLLLPDGYRWPLIGHFSFHEAAIIPIAVWFVMSSSRTWEFSMTDLLVLGYCAVTVISQYHNRNFEDARNTALRDATYIVFPYMLAKGLCRRGNFGLKVAKQIAILLSIVSIVSIYEFKMAVDPFESLVRPFFSVTGPVTTFRYGLTRVSGPFGHALLAGVILLVGYRLARWVEWSGCWQKRFPILGIDAVRCCELCIVAGAAMTVARGAWTGAIAGSLVVLLGRARNRVWAMTTMIAMIVMVGLPIYWGVHSYVSAGPRQDVSVSQQTATYRVDLITYYLPVIEKRPMLGYGQGPGFNMFPVMNGMSSIDDQYLLIALTWGVAALALWSGAFAWILARLLWFGSQRPRDDLWGSLAWTLAGMCILFSVALTTVYLGGQSAALLSMIWGWSEGLLLSPLTALARVKDKNIRYGRVMSGVIIPAQSA